jgi:putative sugar O-methyltransferase
LGGYPSVDALSVALDGDVSIAKAFAGNPLADPHIRELYRVFVGLLWHHARAICGNGLTEQLAEPLLGNPLRCSLGGRLISQDLANSIRECTVCLAPLEAELMSVRPLSVVEIGAGYGRLGFVLLTGTPCRYTVVDIPPALALAQWYLTTLLPQVPTFRFRPWHSFADVQSEMEGTEIRFLTPDQFALCPAGYFDLGITISTLPEMTPAQCEFYLSQLSRTVSRVIYINQWREYHNAQDDITVRREDYILPDPWRLGIDRIDSVHDGFFERLWQRAG